MLSIVWISSSCTTHLISNAANRRCSWTSVEHTSGRPWERTYPGGPTFVRSQALTHGGPAPGAVLTNSWGWAVLTLPMVVCGKPVSTADGVLVIGTALYIQWLLGNGVLRATRTSHYTYNQKNTCQERRKTNNLKGKRLAHISSPAVCLTEPVWSHVLPQPLQVSMLVA